MTEREQKRTSKFLSLVLRHKPEIIDLHLDENGWAGTSDLLQKMKNIGRELSLKQLQEVVEKNDKKRFSFTADFSRIRANQGHSLKVSLDLKQISPPDLLYHGTSEKNLSAIRKSGIDKRQRHHVHLSPDETTAFKVGSRHGKPVVLKVKAREMHDRGFEFYRSENGVWLTEHISPEFIEFPLQ